ncbi:hypothetical protein HZS_883 [Henneguya salminicola]|uniref:Acetyl-coenzyme A transporter 1 (Trinotate prediction) n=1 Tax=Henneguya salminicola TaxID=69463 RepID=A0A6G3MGB0_HENSL|nr:hypothetical protein HZS_883 [Henneguya salminicola]
MRQNTIAAYFAINFNLSKMKFIFASDFLKSSYFYVDVFILIILYTLQGFPIGLSDVFPYIIQTLGASYKDLAKFSITSWPFSLKLLWAPFIESIYIRFIGRRKTWIVLTQLSIGSILIFLSMKVEFYLANISLQHIMNSLIFIFTILTFLAATQDIAVDGWGLNLIPRAYISYASLCNTVGQTAGYIIGNLLFLVLTSSFLNFLTNS